MSDHPGKASDMIKLRMCADHLVNSANASIPKKWSYHRATHVKSFIRRSPVDQYHLSIGQLDHRAIALPDVEKRDAKVITIKKHPWRPCPPQ
jgi:hypothetical protein